MSMSIPISEFDGGSGAPAAKFEKIGDKFAGRITDIVERPQTEPGTGKAKKWDNGDPMMQWVVTIQQSNGDSVSLWAKGGKYPDIMEGSGESMQSAIGTAVRNAGATSVDVGADLAVAHTGLAEPKPGLNPAKLFTAAYKPATASVDADLFA